VTPRFSLGCYTAPVLRRNPHAFRRRAGLPEHVDRHAAARMPAAPDTQLSGAEDEEAHQPARDPDCAVSRKALCLRRSETNNLRGVAFIDPSIQGLVDHEMREIRLAG
jgi:hypothetical protein